MKQNSFLTTLLLAFSSLASSQSHSQNLVGIQMQTTQQGYTKSMNRRDVDSAVYYLQKLTTSLQGRSKFRELVQGYISGVFFGVQDKDPAIQEINYKVLKKSITKGNNVIIEIAKPLFLCIEALRYKDNDQTLLRIADEFIIMQNYTEDLFCNKTIRFALILYEIISKKESLNKSAHALLQSISQCLSKKITHRVDMEEQLWYKWAEACTNYFQGVAVLKEQRVTDAGTFFQKAAQFSSSMQARENALFYYKDMIYLFGEERSFINDYLAYLKKYTNDKEEIFRVLKNESLVNPLKKKSLEMFYKEKFLNGKSFDSVWLDAVDSIGRIAPDFVLTTIRGQTFSLSSQKGKWVFIDFWGTWCGPCREEHPQLDKFAKKIRSNASMVLSIITVACKDKLPDVKKYMQEHQYEFQVALESNAITKHFEVREYPSKYLVSPRGKFIEIPPNTDWEAFVNRYVGLYKIEQ